MPPALWYRSGVVTYGGVWSAWRTGGCSPVGLTTLFYCSAKRPTVCVMHADRDMGSNRLAAVALPSRWFTTLCLSVYRWFAFSNEVILLAQVYHLTSAASPPFRWNRNSLPMRSSRAIHAFLIVRRVFLMFMTYYVDWRFKWKWKRRFFLYIFSFFFELTSAALWHRPRIKVLTIAGVTTCMKLRVNWNWLSVTVFCTYAQNRAQFKAHCLALLTVLIYINNTLRLHT